MNSYRLVAPFTEESALGISVLGEAGDECLVYERNVERTRVNDARSTSRARERKIKNSDATFVGQEHKIRGRCEC
jgi:hypothetical protein